MSTKSSRGLKNQAEAVLALAGDLQGQLTHKKDSEAFVLGAETQVALEKYLDRLPFLPDAASTSIRRQLDNEGTKLWNVCVQRGRTIDNHDGSILLCKAKALAYAMLDAAAPRTCSGNYRALELSFEIIKACVDAGLVNLSQKMMESAAMRLDMLKKSDRDANDLKLDTLSTKYYMLRIYLAWSQERPDIADHLFSKISEIRSNNHQRVVVDICYAIGNSALSSDHYEIAAIWLDRALTVCLLGSNNRVQEVDQGLKDKKLLILHAFARANLRLATTASDSQLRGALELMKTEYGDAFPVLLISLEALSKEGTMDEEYLKALESAIKAMDGDANVNILETFIDACVQFLDKLKVSETSAKEQWIERIFISIIWTLTKSGASEDHCPSLAEAATNRLAGCGLGKLSEDATNASLILIWKYIDTMLAKGFISVAERWCRFVLQQTVFDKSPDTKAKFFRKLILCVLDKYTPSAARAVFDGIPEDYKTYPLTLYLMYRLALVAEDAPLATIYLQSLCNLEANATYLWSLVADAVQLGKTDITIQSLEGLVAVSNDNVFERLQISQLLRYMICAVCEKHGTTKDEQLRGRVVSLFESALRAASREQSRSFSPTELRWLSFKSYSIALKLHQSSPSQTIVRLLKFAVEFTELSQKDQEAEWDVDLLEHNLRCHFLRIMILVTDARRERKSSKKTIYYKEAREVIKLFQAHIRLLNASDSMMIVDTHPPNWLSKYRTVLSFVFEATVFLRQWDDLVKIIEISKSIVDAKLSSVFLDCLLRSGAPSSYLSQFVKQIIRTFHSTPTPSPFLNTNSSSSNFNFTSTLPRYLRCLFSLSSQAEEYILAESILDQVLLLAQNTPNPNTDTQAQPQPQYPKDELHWLATVAFNRAVEFYLISADTECRRWAKKAIQLADLIEGDRVELGRLLRENLKRIQGGKNADG
ncbi:meiosis protein SPO22/ZIP4 like-domain-containing protein [Aspergillus californicus]